MGGKYLAFSAVESGVWELVMFGMHGSVGGGLSTREYMGAYEERERWYSDYD